jgi:hypothetical protein
LLTNHTTPGHSIEAEQIEMRLDNAPQPQQAQVQRIDRAHANPKLTWEEMGQPEYLSEQDVEVLQEASLLKKEKQLISYKDGSVSLKTNLPPHSVASITIDFAPEEANAAR